MKEESENSFSISHFDVGLAGDDRAGVLET